MVGVGKMKFSITGWLGRRITITWEDGKLSSDDQPLLSTIEQIIQEYEQEGFVIQEYAGGPKFDANYLQHPYSAYLILKEILREIEEAPDPDQLRGDLPKYVPEGRLKIDDTKE